MNNKTESRDLETVYCICPSCNSVRKKVNGKFNIIKRGYERNNFARFLCGNCNTWFNERTGDTMKWLER